MPPFVAWIVVFAAVLLSLFIASRISKSEREASQRAREAIDRAIASGERLPDGSVPCIICGGPSTDRVPMFGVAWFDRLVPFRNLYSITPLYKRIDDDSSMPVAVCAVDKDLLGSIIDEICADVRRVTAAHTATQQRRVARLRNGELYLTAQAENEKSRQTISLMTQAIFREAPGPHLLTEKRGEGEGVVVSVAQTSNGKDTEDAAPPSLEVQH